MCIIIVNNKNSVLNEATLRNSFNNNRDGAGFAYCYNNQVHITKGIFDIDEFIKTYYQIKAISTSDILIHCRISTAGNIDTLNCHPHKVTDKIVMAHNGAKLIDTPANSPVSDTIVFIQKHLQKLTPELLQNEYYKQYLKKLSLKYTTNKLVFLTDAGEVTIINNDLGHYDTELNWYSNDSYSYSFYDDWYFTPTKALKKKIKSNIKRLSIQDVIILGDYPLVNTLTGELQTGCWDYNTDEVIPLEELDFDLYSDYINYIDSLYTDNIILNDWRI